MRAIRLVVLVLASASVALMGSNAASAQEDPCLQALAGDAAALQRYDDLVGRYLAAVDAGDYAQKVATLDQLWDTCDANLRLIVLRGDAHRDAGHCEAAAREYLWVLDNADTWPDPRNGSDARTRAAAALGEIRAQCIAELQISCASNGTQVQIGDFPALTCPANVDVPAGSYTITATAPNHRPVARDYDLRAGRAYIEMEALAPLQHPGSVEFVCAAPGTRLAVGTERFDCPATRTFEQGTVHWIAYPPGADPLEGSVDVHEGGSVRVEVPAQAAATTGTLAVQCKQPGVTATVIGPDPASPIETGCPFSLVLAAGTYTIAANAPNYEPKSLEVRVETAGIKQVALILEGTPTPRVLVRALGGAGLLSGYGNSFSTSGQQAKPDPTGVAKLGVALPFGGEGYEMELELHARAGIGDEVGFMGGANVNWTFGGSDVRLFGGFGGNYGTFGVPACAPDDTSCTPTDEAGGFAWGFDVGLEMVLSPRIGAVLVFDAYLPGAVFIADILGGVRVAF